MKIITLLSGGLDSTTLLYDLISQKHEVRAIGFNYGQRHGKELKLAAHNAAVNSTPFTIADVNGLSRLLLGSSQTDSAVPVPEGRYDQENMKVTVVPNRNMMMISIAIGTAISHGFEVVAFAAHAGDHTIYPDCRPEFIELMNRAGMMCDWKQVEVVAPYVNLTKAQIAKRAFELGFDVTKTWSCYVGGEVHCGRCGTCIERREAFYLAGVDDPTIYGVDAPSVEQMVKLNWHLPT